MSKLYRRKESGLIILSGEVMGVESDGKGSKTVKILVREYDAALKEWKERIVNAVSSAADDDVVTGCIATAIGYQGGVDTVFASSVTTGAKKRYIEDIEVLSGPVYKAEFNSEMNADGTQRLKRDGSPRKPHFDITIRIPSEEGHNILHRVKIYNYKENAGNSRDTEIEKVQRIFKDWIDRKETPVEAVIVTKPGQDSSWESEYRGKIYQNFACDHLGKLSWDFNWLNKKEKENGTKASANPSAPAPGSGPEREPEHSSSYSAAVNAVAQADTPAMTGTFGNGSIHVEDDTYM